MRVQDTARSPVQCPLISRGGIGGQHPTQQDRDHGQLFHFFMKLLLNPLFSQTLAVFNLVATSRILMKQKHAREQARPYTSIYVTPKTTCNLLRKSRSKYAKSWFFATFSHS